MHCASDSKYVLKALCKCALHVFPASYCLTICMSTSTCKRNQTGPDLHVVLVTSSPTVFGKKGENVSELLANLWKPQYETKVNTVL